MDFAPIGWGLFFLGLGIAIAGWCIGSGIEEAGDNLKRGFRDFNLTIEKVGGEHEDGMDDEY